ncbi:NAD(P)H-quinone oxidoreductase [Arcanobacterium bovis]|uniref:NAD(P)H-quinone oxidoreductase n=1 Tax=Arcanobacterium bovis TaxID=2529275 RepID=A0A4Q9V412_9ACTO|nr:NAD(P)H-quinone oxidoreductase [Arcanobacterium bovis]TBW23862.1 NAD(P)H-quinone oxidoreductase [Arcanobacterium bovis]
MKAIRTVNEQPTIEVVPVPEPGHNEIRIKVTSAGINRADILQVEGKYPPPPGATDILGLEVSGVVDAIGTLDPELLHNPCATLGAQVMALLQGGGYAQYVTVDIRLAYPIPTNINLTDAAALPEALATAYSNLVLAGGMQAGSRVLIHGGSGGVGVHAVQLAKAWGATVLTTAGSAPRVQRLLDLGADHAIDYHELTEETQLAQWTSEHTDGAGIDVVLDVMGGSGLDANIRTLTDGGKIVIIGTQGGTRPQFNLTRLMVRRGSIIGTTLRSRRLSERIDVQQRVAQDVLPFVEEGKIRPVIERIYPFAQVHDAHAALVRGEVFGKVLLQAPEEAE